MRFEDLRGAVVVDTRNVALGEIEDLLVDGPPWRTRFVLLRTSGHLRRKHAALPPGALEPLPWIGRRIGARLSATDVADRPDFDPRGEFTQQAEDRYLRHFGWPATPRDAARPLGTSGHLILGTDLAGHPVEGPRGPFGEVVDLVLDPSWRLVALDVEHGAERTLVGADALLGVGQGRAYVDLAGHELSAAAERSP